MSRDKFEAGRVVSGIDCDRLSESSDHARQVIRDFLEGRIDRTELYDSAVVQGIIPDRRKIRAEMQAIVDKLGHELSWARAKLHEFDNEKITK
jgi:hypothetical protein